MIFHHQYDVWMCLKMEDGPQQCNFDGNHDVNDDENDDDGDGFDDGYDDDGGCSDNGYVNVADEKGAYQVEGRTTPQIWVVQSCFFMLGGYSLDM